MKKAGLYSLIVLPIVFAILALTFHPVVLREGVAGSGIAILALMCFLYSPRLRSVWIIPAAFLFSIGGDLFLSFRHGDNSMFIAGIAMFFLAHAGFLFFALQNGKLNIPVLVTVLSGYLVFFFRWLSPGIESNGLKTAVFLYLIISCISLASASGINQFPGWGKFFFIAGILSILFSDTIIALREFVSWHTLDDLIMPTYYLSHISIVFALMLTIFWLDNSEKITIKPF